MRTGVWKKYRLETNVGKLFGDLAEHNYSIYCRGGGLLGVVKDELEEGVSPQQAYDSERFCAIIRCESPVPFHVKQETPYTRELFEILRHYLDFDHQEVSTTIIE